jgi:hypothetical protein
MFKTFYWIQVKAFYLDESGYTFWVEQWEHALPVEIRFGWRVSCTGDSHSMWADQHIHLTLIRMRHAPILWSSGLGSPRLFTVSYTDLNLENGRKWHEDGILHAYACLVVKVCMKV